MTSNTRHTVLKNSFWQFKNHRLKNTNLIERSTIDERLSVDGFDSKNSVRKGAERVFQHNRHIADLQDFGKRKVILLGDRL